MSAYNLADRIQKHILRILKTKKRLVGVFLIEIILEDLITVKDVDVNLFSGYNEYIQALCIFCKRFASNIEYKDQGAEN